MLLLSSDPYLAFLRSKWNVPKVEFDKEDEDSKEIFALLRKVDEEYDIFEEILK